MDCQLVAGFENIVLAVGAKYLSIDYPALTAHKTGHMLINCGEYTPASAMCVKGATSTGYFLTEYPGPPL